MRFIRHPVTLDLARRVDETVRIEPHGLALHFDEQWRPWEYMSRAVDAIDATLVGLGLGGGARIGVVMRNRPAVVRALVALLATRRCVVTLSPFVPVPILLDDVRRLELGAVLVDSAWDATTCPILAGSAGADVLRIGDDVDPVVIDHLLPPTRLPAREAPGVAIEMLTSGSTGPPRRVGLTYRSLEHEYESTLHYGAGDELREVRLRSGTAVTWAPFVHVGGIRAVISWLLSGRRLAMLERFEVESWRRLVSEHRPRVMSLVPAALRMVYDADVPIEVFDGVRAVVCGTAPVSAELVEAFQRRYGVAVLTVYGATEFGGVAGWTLRDWELYGADKRGSVGRANVGVSLRVVDQNTGEVLGPGAMGLLEVRAAQAGGPEWQRTTDLAHLDPDGFLWIDGRVDDIIVRGGFKISAAKVREALTSHPAVRDAVVLGKSDQRLGQVPVALVEAPVTPVGLAELAAHLRNRLTGYEIPATIRVVPRLPRTPSLKPDAVAVRRMLDSD